MQQETSGTGGEAESGAETERQKKWNYTQLAEEYHDVRLVANNGETFTWNCSCMVESCPSLLHMASQIKQSCTSISLFLPLSAQLLQLVTEGTLPEETLEKEKLLHELASIDDNSWQPYQDTIIGDLCSAISPSNCISLWILCRHYSNEYQTFVLRYSLYHLVKSLRNMSLCRQYFRPVICLPPPPP
ncbi:hypothetical protein WR25_25526 [Diploscapter pachys]|uniref:Uncharacterized protein n=1 Tax=Diploscapter pachys TaxID=2018661 RepID=A0A2A2JFR6_9BILA|nr:hypothetical protein WR25_25526 [Diploscapter pachys]